MSLKRSLSKKGKGYGTLEEPSFIEDQNQAGPSNIEGVGNVQNEKTFKESNFSKPKDFAAILYAEPSALGFLCNFMAALSVAFFNFLDDKETPNVAYVLNGGILVLIGGVLQGIAGLLSYRRNDHMGATAFIVFSSLWSVQGIFQFYLREKGNDLDAIRFGSLSGCATFCAIALILFISSLTVNYIMPPLLVCMMGSLLFEAVGLYYSWAKILAGVIELAICIMAAYGFIALCLKGISQKHVWKGFGNAPWNVLLIKAKTSSQTSDKKKNTKYAEPMGMGYVGNVIGASILAFYYFGIHNETKYFLPWMIGVALCQGLALYYSFLRKDAFHCFSFATFVTFWLSVAGTAFICDTKPANHSLFIGSYAVVLFALVLFLWSLTKDKVTLMNSFIFLVCVICSLPQIPSNASKYTAGVSYSVLALFSLYFAFTNIVNSVAEKPVIRIGEALVSQSSMEKLLMRLTCKTNTRPLTEKLQAFAIHDSVTFMLNSIATWSLVTQNFYTTKDSNYALAWIGLSGILGNLFTARLAYSIRCFSRCSIQVIWAFQWLFWVAMIYNGPENSSIFTTPVIIVCVVHVLVALATLRMSLVWIFVTFLYIIQTIPLILKAFGYNPEPLLVVIDVFLGIALLYGSFTCFINADMKKMIFPQGSSCLGRAEDDTEAEDQPKDNPCPVYSSRLTSGILGVAKLLDNGGVCGIPTDTVYALGASCKHPQMIKKIYKIKGRPSEKPICLCVSRLDQLRKVNPPFSKLLWDFMSLCNPGGISCIVPKGEWLTRLGLKDAIEYIGTKDSVCIRVPDSAALAHLIDRTGPLGITSANPSGEPDSTHHSQVLDRLGVKLDGMLCDGYSNETKPSTVVNCMNIDKGEIVFVRIGCTPKEIVEDKFLQAQREMRQNEA